jgi:CubicO group peptidase (beta-lactamase class C family)
MKILFLIIFTICVNVMLPAQSLIRQKTDSVSRLVLREFNKKNVAGLYEMTGDSFKKALTYESFLAVCQNNLFPLGDMKEASFEKEINGICKYKAVFNSMNVTLLLGLDKTDKIETFLFKPYVDDNAKKEHKVVSTNKMISQLDIKVDSATQPYISLQAATGLSIGILRNGKNFYYGYGETAKENGQLPDEHTIFEIGSISKTFTSLLLADAVVKGRVKLDDPVGKYFPDSIPAFEFGGTPITLKTLSNHTSGIPRMPTNFHPADNENPYKDYDDGDMFSYYKTFRLSRKPGSQFEYSNLAGGTLGVILEKVYKKNYQDLFVETICGPLGMNDTREFIRKTDSARFAKGYNEEGRYNSPWDFEALAPAGSIRSTSADLLIYANANLGTAPKSLEKAIQLTHVETFTDGNNKIALGWLYIKPGKDEVLFHNGGTGGFRSYLAINLNKKFAVVVLSNTSIGVEDVGNSIMKWLEENPQ